MYVGVEKCRQDYRQNDKILTVSVNKLGNKDRVHKG